VDIEESSEILTIIGEISLLELVLLDLEGVLEETLGLLSTNGDMDGNLLISFDRKTSNGVPSFRFNWFLERKILEHLGGLGEGITRLSGTEIENEFLDLDLTHLVVLLFLLSDIHIFSKPAKTFNNNTKTSPNLYINKEKIR
jgi:hypothetical protein